MVRVAYGDEARHEDDGLDEALHLIAKERGGVVPNMFRALLHEPDIALAWLRLGTALRRGHLERSLRELSVCAVSYRLNCDYILDHHAPLAIRAGVSPRLLDLLRTRQSLDEIEDRRAAVVVDAAFSITEDGRVSETTFTELKAHLCDREVTELIAAIAFYNCVARFVLALDVAEDPVAPGV